MALGWLSILSKVPWTDVVGNAPLITDSAKKLWHTVAKKPQVPEAPIAAGAPSPPPSVDSQAIAVLQTKLDALEAVASEQHRQMLASSELLKALAGQNAQLIQRVETQRIRLLRVAMAAAVIGVIAMTGLVLAFLR